MVLLLLWAVGALAFSVDVLLPTSAPVTQFAGFGIEFSNIFSFTGTSSSPNTFSQNLLKNLANLAGPIPVRVGGNTQDYSLYRPGQASGFSRNPNANGTGAGPGLLSDSNLYGDGLFTSVNLLTDTEITFGLNLAYEGADYLDQITSAAHAAATQLDNLISFEIGNEPDLYASTSQFRTTFAGTDYVTSFVSRAQAIQSQVLAPNNRSTSFFDGGTTASTIGTSFQISLLGQDGINKTGAVKYYNQHDYFYYIGVTGFPLTRTYMLNHQNIVSQFASWKTQIQQSNAQNTSYVLGEMAAVGPQGLANITDVFASAIWGADFFLYAASINCSRVLMHMTDVGLQSAWQPITIRGVAPQVRPLYYAHVVMCQLFGMNKTKVVELSTPFPQTSAYAVYHDKLTALVFINLKEFNSSGTPGYQTFTATTNSSEASVLRLTAPGADARTNITWAGLNYQTADGRPMPSYNDSQTVVLNGSISVDVRDTELAVVFLDTTTAAVAASATPSAANTTTTTTTTTSPSNRNKVNILIIVLFIILQYCN